MQNVGTFDRAIRLIVAVAALVVALLTHGWIAAVSWLVAITGAVSGLTGFALPYKLLGISTVRGPKRKLNRAGLFYTIAAVLAAATVIYSLLNPCDQGMALISLLLLPPTISIAIVLTVEPRIKLKSRALRIALGLVIGFVCVFVVFSALSSLQSSLLTRPGIDACFKF